MRFWEVGRGVSAKISPFRMTNSFCLKLNIISTKTRPAALWTVSTMPWVCMDGYCYLHYIKLNYRIVIVRIHQFRLQQERRLPRDCPE